MNARIAIAATVAALVIAAAFWIVRRDTPPPAAAPPVEASQPQVLYWYDPMKPEVHFDAPGRSPFMDMALVPKYAESGDAGTVSIDPRIAQNLGVRTAAVTRGTFWQRVDTTGRVEVDERTRLAVALRADGWVEALHVRSAGGFVAAGAPLADVYSPTIAAAERELSLAVTSKSDALVAAALVAAARAQLEALGVGRPRIDALVRGATPEPRFTLFAPRAGYVMRLNVQQGQAVAPAEPLLELASHDPIWVLADVPERQASWIAVGGPAEVRLPSLPGRVLEGQIDYLYPELDTVTRTLRARVVLANPDDALHPGMFANVTLFGGARRDVLLVPSEAVIRTGERTVVVVAEDGGRYRPTDVGVGAERRGQTIVESGLVEGQSVVVSGQFLIDSEASLRGAAHRAGGAPIESGGHDHAHGATP
jgi:Cu(I)/Ag(I) efflux system membrane fusion protein